MTEDNRKVSLRRNELVRIIDASIGIVDLSFDILVGLHKKRVVWKQLEDCSKDFGENFTFIAKSMPPLNLSFQQISSTIERQIPKETSKEAYNILKNIYAYFDGLSLDDDLRECVPNFQTAKAIVLSYYMLNDILLGKVVKDKETNKETHELENMLQILTNNTPFKVNIEALIASIEQVIPTNDLDSLIDDSREIFKEQLKHLSTLFIWSMSKR